MNSIITYLNSAVFTAILLALLFTGCKDNTTGVTDEPDAPTIVTTSPEHNAVNIERDALVTITFSEEMNAATINSATFTVNDGTSNVEGTVSYSGTMATFTATELLNTSVDYTAAISIGAKSAKGIALESETEWSFTTLEEIVVPTVVSTSPENNDENVERNTLITITFSEEMDAATINSSTFTVNQGTSSVEGAVTYSGTMATFTATNPLSASEVYTAAISVEAMSSKGVALESATEWIFTTGGSTATLEVVDLGAAANYVILAKSAINNNPTSAITGDLGLSPAAESYITGFSQTAATGYSTSDQVTGKIYAADMADPTPSNLTTAVDNMNTAYNDAAGRPSPDFFELHTGNIGGKTLAPGLYKWTNTVTAPTSVELSGDENAVWIFQIAEDLTVSSDVNFTLSGGAQAKNIFWQVAGEVTIGTGSHFEGIILSKTGITLTTGASINGRMMAQTAVILDGNTVVEVTN